MKLNKKKLIPYLVVIVPFVLALVLSDMMRSFYLKKVETCFNAAQEHSLNETILKRKESAELYVKEINLLFEKRYSKVEENAKKELKDRIDRAYKTARFIYEKYKGKKSNKNIKERIVDALGQMKYGADENYVFITDYRANSILLGTQNIEKKNLASYVDADYRSIILEEIQKVRRHKEGFLKTRDAKSKEEALIFVKDLGALHWFIGTSVKLQRKANEIKTQLKDIVQNLPTNKSNFILLFDENKNIISATKEQKKLHNNELKIIKTNLSKGSIWREKNLHDYYYFTAYSKSLNWYFVYGFKILDLNEQKLQKQKDLVKILQNESNFISKVSFVITLFVLMVSFFLSWRYKNLIQ